MRANDIASLFPVLEFAVEFGDREREGSYLLKLFCLSTIGALDLPSEQGERGGRTKSLAPGRRQVCSNMLATLLTLSTRGGCRGMD